MNIESSGTLVLWTSADSTFLHCKAALQVLGLPLAFMPPEVSTIDAIRHALTSLYGGRNGHTIQSLRNGRKGFGAMRIVSTVNDIGGENDVTVEVFSGIASESIRITFFGGAIADTEEQRIRDAINAQRNRVDSQKVSAMLADIMQHENGVRLKNGSGIWYVPASRAERMRTIRNTMDALVPGISIHLIGMTVDDDSVQAAIDSIRNEAAQLAADIMADIAGGLSSATAYKFRQAKLDAMMSRLTEYEKSLGVAMPDIRAGIDACSTHIMMSSCRGSGLGSLLGGV